MMRGTNIAILVGIVALSQASAIAATSYSYSPQDLLIGADSTLQASANYGKGVTFGVIDTGIIPQWIGFSSQYNGQGVNNINTSQSGVCLNGTCRVGGTLTDGNGHGTFVASEIVGGIPNSGLVGIAPGASLLSVQVLGSNGSGTSTDVSNGIRYAVDHGAQVLNLSLGPSGTASQQAAFYNSIAAAVNYAASKNAVIVFAGGNAAQALSAGANIAGYSDAAIARMIFAGSTNTSKQISSFSNTPGTAGFVSTSGKSYAYRNMWLMVDGEGIWGASTYSTAKSEYSYITQMSGTSMAAPQIAGAAGLLAAKWSFLLAQGTIPLILETTATDLGTKGVDSQYGSGFVNLTAAFQPVGQLTIPVNGKMVPVTSSQISSSSATGNMKSVSSALQQMVAYDSFMRGFSVYVSTQVTTPTSSSNNSATTKTSSSTSTATRMLTSFAEGEGWAALSGTQGDSTNGWSYGLSQGGTYIGMGQGSQAALSFNDARWGKGSAFFNNDTGAIGSLLNVVPSSNFASVGMETKHNSRYAFSMFTTEGNSAVSSPANATALSATGAAMAYTHQVAEGLDISITSAFMDEKNMFLGAVSNGYLALGSGASTVSLGMGINADLGDGLQIGFDAIYASTRTSGASGSVFDGVSRIGSESFSLAASQNDLTGAGDVLHISLDKPLRVISGSAKLNVPVGTDNNANPIIVRQKVGLTPDGNETDFNMSYTRPLLGEITSSFSLTYRNDADNVAGAHDAAAMSRFKLSF